MKTVRTVRELRGLLTNSTMGVNFIPTMGALHQGHIDLVNRSKIYPGNNTTVVSIFVNPTQFAPTDDLSKYPRTEKEDVEKLKAAGVDIVFIPSPEEMYPDGQTNLTMVDPIWVKTADEAISRPTHFRGVCTVVTKLFNMVQPTRAFFGRKDALQCIVIGKMNRDLNGPTQIITCPTYREKDGLAMSSRNVYLSNSERQVAPELYKALSEGAKIYSNTKPVSVEMITQSVMTHLNKYPFVIDYVNLMDYSGQTLKPSVVVDHPAILSLAVKLGNTRLIDNIWLPVLEGNFAI